MPMCQDCGKVVGVADIKNGFCVDCQKNHIEEITVAESQDAENKTKEDNNTSFNAWKIILVFIPVLLIYVGLSERGFSGGSFSIGEAFLPSLIISVVGFYIIQSVLVFIKELKK